MRFVAVMIGMDAHGFEREFSRLEVHGNELRSNQPPKVARGVFRNPDAMD